MPTLVVHAGMPKTATTTLQRHLARGRHALSARGLLYPGDPALLTRERHDAVICSVLPPEHRAVIKIARYLDPISADQARARIDAERAACGAETVIVSSELMWSPIGFPVETLRAFRDAFAGSGYQVKALVSLRGVRSHAYSSYAQRIRGYKKFTGSFARHIASRRRQGTWGLSERLAQFGEAFGAERVFPVWFEEIQPNLLAPLARLCETPDLADLVGFDPAAAANAAPEWSELWTLRRRNLERKWRDRSIAPLKAASHRLALSLEALASRGAPAPQVRRRDRAFLEALDAAERAEVARRFDTDWWR